jgi:hypothetical protein
VARSLNVANSTDARVTPSEHASMLSTAKRIAIVAAAALAVTVPSAGASAPQPSDSQSSTAASQSYGYHGHHCHGSHYRGHYRVRCWY